MALRRYDHLHVVRVEVAKGILQRGHDGLGNVTYNLVFLEGHERLHWHRLRRSFPEAVPLSRPTFGPSTTPVGPVRPWCVW